MCLKLLVTRFGSRQMFGFSVCFFFLRFLNGVHESTAPLFAVTAQKSFEFFVNAFPHPVPTGWGMGGWQTCRENMFNWSCFIRRVTKESHWCAFVPHPWADAPSCIMPLIQLTASVVLHEPLQRGPFHMQRCTRAVLKQRQRDRLTPSQCSELIWHPRA